jgi:hypothetical protein
MLFPDIFFSQTEEKKKKGKKNHKKEKNTEKGRNFPSSSRSALSLLDFASALPLLPSRFCLSILNVFSWRLFLFK